MNPLQTYAVYVDGNCSTIPTRDASYGIELLGIYLIIVHPTAGVLKKIIDWSLSIGAKHVPCRIKTQADITADEARARVIEGWLQDREIISLLKRTTDLKLFKESDRDDIVDITDFDVVVCSAPKCA